MTAGKMTEQDLPNTLIGVFLDHNAWDVLFALRLDLAVELPSDEFGIGITREAEFEIAATAARNPELKAYIDDTIAKCRIETDSYFGFYCDSFAREEQRVAGFDVGRWASSRELEFIAQQQRWLREEKRKTKLYVNEADISLAARSFVSVVLTCDKKPGPLRDAYEQGGMVVYLNGFETSGLSLRNYIKAAISSSR
jgi:hypothetical protein